MQGHIARRLFRLGLVGLAGATLTAGGCVSEAERQLDESRATWEELRDSAQGNYTYARYSHSFADEYGWSTHFTVESNAVVRRELTVEEGSDREPWIETGADLGSHDDGFDILTIDQIYDICEQQFLHRDPSKYDLTLTFHENGVLGSCHSREHGYVDDSEGVDIDVVELTPITCAVAPCG
jgi:hypothetical protein